MLKRVATDDESWIFEYHPLTKRQSLEWKSALSPRFKMARMFESKTKGKSKGEGRKEENCGKRGHGCFIMTMLQLVMPWEFGSFLPKIPLLYWSNYPTIQIWPLVTFFCFSNSRKSSKELVFKNQMPLKQLWRKISKRSQRYHSRSAWKHDKRKLEKYIRA